MTLFVEYRKDRFADEPAYHKTVIKNCSWNDRRAASFFNEGSKDASELYIRIPTVGRTMEADAGGKKWIPESEFFDSSGGLAVDGDSHWTLKTGAFIIQGEYPSDTPPRASQGVPMWTIQRYADNRDLNNTPRLWHWRVTAK